MGIFDKFKIIVRSKFGSAESPRMVYYFAKLIGLAPFTLKDDRLRPPTTAGLFYSIVVAVAHLLLMAIATAFTVVQVQQTTLPQGRKIWAVMRYLVCLPATFIILAIFILSRKKMINMANQLIDMSETLESLGIQENSGKMFNNVIVTTAVANAVMLTMCVLASLTELRWHIFRKIGYGVGVWFNLNVLLIYVQVLICIGQRFELLNKRLCEIFVRPRVTRSSRNMQMLTMNEEIGEDSEDLIRFELIRKAEGLHLDLSQLMDGLTDIFDLPILLNSIQFFSVMATSGEWVYSTVHNCSSSGCHAIDTYKILGALFRIAIALGQMTMIAHFSSTTCKRGNASRATMTEMWNEFRPAELQDEFFMFSVHLADEPIAVSIFGIFDLNYSYVYQMCGSAVTYIAVILQFGGDQMIRHVNKLQGWIEL